MWLDVPASKTQLLYTCTCAVNFHWLIHSTCLIDELAISGQLQHAANLLKFRHFTHAHSSIGPRFSLSCGHVCLSSLTCAAANNKPCAYKAVLQDISLLSISRAICTSLGCMIVYTNRQIGGVQLCLMYKMCKIVFNAPQKLYA